MTSPRKGTETFNLLLKGIFSIPLFKMTSPRKGTETISIPDMMQKKTAFKMTSPRKGTETMIDAFACSPKFTSLK